MLTQAITDPIGSPTHGARPHLCQILAVLQCPSCGSVRADWRTDTGSVAGFDGDSRLVCRDCRIRFVTHNGYLDMRFGTRDERITPIQHLMQFPPAVAIYENVWRPIGYFIASQHSFPKDLRRITALVKPSHRQRILDLACGTGNFTRSIAAAGPDATVVGFDLSQQMLERAVRLTSRKKLANAFYIRGNALALPFRPNTFDAINCCGALQLFTDRNQALREVSRVLKPEGHFVCQTIIGPRSAPVWVRLADRALKFGYFQIEDLQHSLERFHFRVIDDERSKISYIFRARKFAPAASPNW